MGEITVSIIIVGLNHKFCIENCLKSIYTQNTKEIEVIYVDNNSIDDSILFIESNFKDVIVVKNSRNTGYAKANNKGIALAKGDYIFILNPDIELEYDTIQSLIDFNQKSRVLGLCMPLILHKDYPHTINSMGMIFKKNGNVVHINDGKEYIYKNQIAEVPCVSGAAIFTKKEVLRDIGGFDEDFFAYGEDVELSLRCWRKGYKCFVVPKAKIYHIRNSAAKKSNEYYKLAQYLNYRNFYWNIIIYFPTKDLIFILSRNSIKEVRLFLKYLLISIFKFKIQIYIKAKIISLLFLRKLLKKRKNLKFKNFNNLFFYYN